MAPPSDDRPDLVLIMTDQHRAGLTAETGYAVDTMPTLDGLIRQGAVFDAAFTSYPACVPARTSLLTGRFPTAHRVRQNSTPEQALYDRDLLDVLRAAGYRLHFAGKTHMHRGSADFDTFAGPYWHESGPRSSAEHVAFDSWLGDLDHGVSPVATPFPLEAQLPYRIVSDAVAAVDRDHRAHPGAPTFTWVSFPEPHNPYQVPEPYFSLFDPAEIPERRTGPEAMDSLTARYRWLRDLVERKRPGYDDHWRRYVANYLGMLRLLDDQIARLLQSLPDSGRERLVVFVSDHGDFVGEYGLQRKGAGMSDALMRIPLVISGPAVGHRGHRPELVSITDVLPTLCDLVGLELPDGVQGRSLAPLLSGEPAPAEEFDSVYGELGYGGVGFDEDEHPPLHFPYEGPTFDELNSVTLGGGERMVRTATHKLIVDDHGRGQLFELESDPAELRNRFDDPGLAEVRHDLLVTLTRWMIRVADDLPVGAYRPKTVPHNWRWAPPAGPPNEGVA